MTLITFSQEVIHGDNPLQCGFSQLFRNHCKTSQKEIMACIAEPVWSVLLSVIRLVFYVCTSPIAEYVDLLTPNIWSVLQVALVIGYKDFPPDKLFEI
jgi:hypothetical protein